MGTETPKLSLVEFFCPFLAIRQRLHISKSAIRPLPVSGASEAQSLLFGTNIFVD